MLSIFPDPLFSPFGELCSQVCVHGDAHLGNIMWHKAGSIVYSKNQFPFKRWVKGHPPKYVFLSEPFTDVRFSFLAIWSDLWTF